VKLEEIDLVNFVIREARMLDEQEYDTWLDLFAEDGIYWMPLEVGQTEEKLTTSLMYEDLLLLRTRVQRLSGKRTFSQKPKSRCQHLLQTPIVDKMDTPNNDYQVFTPFHYVEVRNDEKELYAGWMKHSLAIEDEKLKIKLKRVDLVNCDAPHRNIQLFI
jgi:3-phenylpropionate/cinnamic acid dioxygenase small subunit